MILTESFTPNQNSPTPPLQKLHVLLLNLLPILDFTRQPLQPLSDAPSDPQGDFILEDIQHCEHKERYGSDSRSFCGLKHSRDKRLALLEGVLCIVGCLGVSFGPGE